MTGNGIKLSEAERKRRSEHMRALNQSGRNGRRKSKSEDEIRRESLIKIIKTGSSRQVLDATKALEALDAKVKESGAVRRGAGDFESYTQEQIDEHLEALVIKFMNAWYASTKLPQLQAEFEKRGLGAFFDEVVERNSA